MKQSLSLKLGQQLTMTPQLQQAIRLLQLSTLELQLEVQQALESNPMLELEEEADEDASMERASEGDAEGPAGDEGVDGGDTEGAVDAGDELSLEDARRAELSDDLPVDGSWEDLYLATPVAADGAASEAFDLDSRPGPAEGLQEHLRWQLNLTPMSDRDRAIALLVIDSIDGDGRLATTLEELAEAFEPEDGIELDEVAAVVKRVQQFDPPGVAARDLRECLLLQLEQLPADTPRREAARSLLCEHLELLAAQDLESLKRRTRLEEGALREAIALIQTLDPRPGARLDDAGTEYVIPDIIVHKEKGRWKVELNPEATPRLRINPSYASLVRRGDNGSDNNFLRENLQQARWFLKSLQSRHETLIKVASRIVEHQRGFLEYGEEAMKPLVLSEIADAMEMHESTVSRVTTRKYMHTPRGVFELKYFFSSHVGTSTGGEISSTAIRALIKKLIAKEDPRKPLSDSKIVKLLAEQKIEVARRTVAKYRESLMIPPSHERKRLL